MSYFERFRRVLVLVDGGRQLESTLVLVERMCPHVEHVHCVCMPKRRNDPVRSEQERDQDMARVEAALKSWQQRAPGMRAEASFAGAPHLAQVEALALELQVDLVVLGRLAACAPRDRTGLLLRLGTRHARHVLSVGARLRSAVATAWHPARLMLALDADAAALPALASFVAAQPAESVTKAFVPGTNDVRRHELASMFQARSPQHEVTVLPLDTSGVALAQAVHRAARAASSDLIVSAVDAVSGLEALALGLFAGPALQLAACPMLVLPRQQEAPLYLREHLSASDVLMLPGLAGRTCVERVGPWGHALLSTDEDVMVIEGGREHDARFEDTGVVVLPESFAELHDQEPIVVQTRANAAGSAAFNLVRAERPLVLLDSHVTALPATTLAELSRRFQFVFVRLRRTEAVEDVRASLQPYADVLGVPVLIDASTWLDDGSAEDVPRIVDGQRLLRVALRVISAGAEVVAVVTKSQRLRSHVCDTLIETEFAAHVFSERSARRRDGVPDQAQRLAQELDLYSDTAMVPGHRVRISFDNTVARREVLQLIHDAKERLHWQCYIVEDDAITAEFADALTAAAARGVRVRFLADALYSLHQAFGQQNSFLARLAQTPGISVLAYRPVSGVPDLSALKRRNHRKCIVVDGTAAVVTGRNLGAPYYRGFSEVNLRASSLYREVPWLDCGAHFTGPLVTSLERAFEYEWLRAGGDSYPIHDATGDTQEGSRARLVLHEGLRDTHTFDAQLALIRGAQRELVLVNTFPLVLELQRALVTAVNRGVRVRVLFGSVRPHYGNGVAFAGGTLRSLADQLVRSRLDAIVAAGGEVYEYALLALPQWDPALERIFPNVHAKLLIRDRTDVAVGSANLDVTAAYWESEAMLLVHDAEFGASVCEALEPHFESSRRVEQYSDAHRSEASGRAWLSRYWPSLIG